MKTLAQSISVSIAIYITLFLLLIASVAFGSENTFNEPSAAKVAPPEVVFEEEAYIDDIPFDTKTVVENYYLEQSMSVEFNFEDEAYVDDIPFDTHAVALNKWIENRLKYAFDFEEETYVDDIPFNTEKIASEVFFIYYSAK